MILFGAKMLFFLQSSFIMGLRKQRLWQHLWKKVCNLQCKKCCFQLPKAGRIKYKNKLFAYSPSKKTAIKVDMFWWSNSRPNENVLQLACSVCLTTVYSKFPKDWDWELWNNIFFHQNRPSRKEKLWQGSPAAHSTFVVFKEIFNYLRWSCSCVQYFHTCINLLHPPKQSLVPSEQEQFIIMLKICLWIKASIQNFRKMKLQHR